MTMPDLRPQLTQAQEWVATLIEGVHPRQLDQPTPCTDFDVRALIEHLFAVQGRIRRIAEEGTIGDSPFRVPLPDAPLGTAFRQLTAATREAWGSDELLPRIVTAPFGQVPGAVAVIRYVGENLTHGWDLATATGQDPEVDPELARQALALAQQGFPATGRRDMPFADAVPAAPDAGPTERLANWMGRRSR